MTTFTQIIKNRSFYCLVCSLVFMLGAISTLAAQTSQVDSLQNLLETDLPDSTRVDVLNSLGDIVRRSSPQEGMTYFEEILAIAEENDNERYRAIALGGIGSCYRDLGELDTAEDYWNQALALGKSLKDTVGLGKMYSNLGILYEIRGDLDTATLLYEQSLGFLAQQEEETFELAAARNNLGLVYEKQGNYAKSAEYFLASLAGFEELAMDRGIAVVLGNLGMVYYKRKEYDQAIEYYHQSIGMKKKLNNLLGLASSYNNLGGLYETTNKLDSALFYHQKSLEIKEQVGNPLEISASYNNIGIAHYRLEDYERARDYQLKAYEIARQEESNSDLARSAADLGRAYLKLGQSDLAERYLQEALTLSERVGERENSLKVYGSLYEVYKRRGDFRAFDFYEKYVALKDSLRSDEQTREITRLEMQYEFDKEKEILELERQQNEALLQSQIQRQRLIRNASLGGLGAGMAILFVLWQSYRQKQESNRQLEEQRDTIQRALEDRETLLKEIHHRVKNNLQIISSLLSLQSRQIADPKALEAIQEGRNRVNSMALIHKNLYQDENLVGVDTLEYIDKLTESLIASYNINLDHITIEKDIDRMKLDVDTIIPLGLILNELISNSLKYAFPSEQQGKIKTVLKKKPDGFHLEVADNGKGLPPDFDIENLKSLGFRLVKAFAQKLNAELKVRSGEGTRIELFVPNERFV